MSRAQSQFQERCLSLKTGTLRPLLRKTSTIWREELVPRIQRLPFFIAGIVAVLADQEDAVDGQFARCRGERLGNGGGHGGARGTLSARAALKSPCGSLVDVERDQVHGRMVVPSVPTVTVEKAIDDVLGVGVFVVDGDDGGDAGAGSSRRFSARNLLNLAEERFYQRSGAGRPMIPGSLTVVVAVNGATERWFVPADFFCSASRMLSYGRG